MQVVACVGGSSAVAEVQCSQGKILPPFFTSWVLRRLLQAKGGNFKGLTNSYHFQNCHSSISSRIDVDLSTDNCNQQNARGAYMANASALPSFEGKVPGSSIDDMDTIEMIRLEPSCPPSLTPPQWHLSRTCFHKRIIRLIWWTTSTGR